eukprot:8650381-Pyramimonas_sp.AAC.1
MAVVILRPSTETHAMVVDPGSQHWRTLAPTRCLSQLPASDFRALALLFIVRRFSLSYASRLYGSTRALRT